MIYDIHTDEADDLPVYCASEMVAHLEMTPGVNLAKFVGDNHQYSFGAVIFGEKVVTGSGSNHYYAPEVVTHVVMVDVVMFAVGSNRHYLSE